MTLALEFAATVRGGRTGRFTDLLATPEGFAAWAGRPADDALRHRVVTLRWATRSLFARVVGQPAGRPDSAHLPDPARALEIVNEAAARAPRAARLEWADEPVLTYVDTASPDDRLLADLATAVIEFLGGEARADLRACLAPGCVRYFVKAHPRQEWCKPSCGNRARVSRHYRRAHEA
ncbi:ABATE domain-containing protein [Actinosynnema sp. NPDC020468]|uniref:CGNR zinc finger domain-containing protein n=1 Tax=Actinosynnema sp. NPDC020468 TaxID=3154488 RepID=UPI0033E6DFDF